MESPYRPAAHGVHTPSPKALKEPAGQGLQVTGAVLKKPAGHNSLTCAVMPAPEMLLSEKKTITMSSPAGDTTEGKGHGRGWGQ